MHAHADTAVPMAPTDPTGSLDPSMLGALNRTYCRISDNVDFEAILQSTLIVAGTGASGAMIEGLARIGLRHFHLFDPDRVEPKNLAAQNFTTSDIGLPKTLALEQRLAACAFEADHPDLPRLQVACAGDFLAVSDEDFEVLIDQERAAGRRPMLLLSSDSHPVQARGNRLALKHAVPAFFVGIYRRGMAGEIIFVEPGFDLPCYRCIAETRYRAWDSAHLPAHRAGKPAAGAGRSAGLPMAASFIDAILSHLIVGAIHKDVEANPHGRLYRRLLAERRTFIQTQLDPSYRLNGDEDLFAQVAGPDVITFNTLFQQEPVKPACPDCTPVAAGGGLSWQHTDYCQEAADPLPERDALAKPEASHPLRRDYAALLVDLAEPETIV